METTKQIEYLRSLIKTHMTYSPSFIDTEDSVHKFVWGYIQAIYRQINKLTNEKVLLPLAIDNIVKEVNLRIDYILELIQDPDIEVQISHLILISLDQYEEICVSMELYEPAANIKLFREKYISLK